MPNQKKVTHQFKFLTFITMLYMTVKLTTVVLIYKIIKIGPFTASASTFVMPLWFVMGDIIAEVYGYKIARHIIWIAIICQFIFAALCSSLILIHSPTDWAHQEAYNQVLGKLPRVAFASFLAIVSGAFINAYVISRWKIVLRGRYFWLRSLAATTVGELVFTVTAYLTEFIGVTPLPTLLHLMAISFLIKLVFNPILIFPSTFLTIILKKIEGIDLYDINTKFNPFTFGLGDESVSNSQNRAKVANNIQYNEV